MRDGKRIGCLLLALLLALTGCGAFREEPPAAPTEWGADAPTVTPAWTVRPTEAPPEPDPDTPAPEESLPVPEEEPEAAAPAETEAAPVPTPGPLYTSLTELCDPGTVIYVEGEKLTTLRLGEQTLVSAQELAHACGWAPWEVGGADAAVLYGPTGLTFTVPITTVDGEEFPVSEYGGSGGVLFDGGTRELWLPLGMLTEAFGMTELRDEAYACAYYMLPVDKSLIPQDVKVPVLMYHAVSDELWGIGSLFVSPTDMEAQIRYLLDNGFDPIWFSDLTHLGDYDKPILLTFDDGYDDNYTYLLPILEQYGVKATVFVITGFLGGEHYMTYDQAAEMSRSGLVDIQSHTVTHDRLSELSYEDQEYQMAQSRLDIARLTGKIPYVLSYPEGERDDHTLSLAPRYYDFAVDMNGGLWYTYSEDYYTIDRIYISRFDTIDEFAAAIW